MTSEAKSRWLTVAAVAASTGLIVGLFVLNLHLEQDRRAQEENLLDESYQGLRGEELARAVYLEAAGLVDATPEPPLSPERRAALRAKFLEVARSQRRQLERLYLTVLSKLADRDPCYVAAVEGRSGWPYDQFEIDFRAFQHQRARYGQALEEEDWDTCARLEEIEQELQQELSDLPSRPEVFRQIEEGLKEKLQQLDRELQSPAEASLARREQNAIAESATPSP